nr:DUF3187 family protein [uncultured Marinifilum sp.]
MKFVFSLCVVLLISVNISLAQKLVEPFPTHNQSPLIHFFGLQVNSGGVLLHKNEFIFSNYLNIANNATISQFTDELVYFDGEMYRNDIRLRYGLSDRFELSICLPLVRHSGGVMDSFISGWHEAFGLPGKARETMQNYNLTYLYQENDQTIVSMKDGKLKIGDISLLMGTSLLKTKNHFMALRGFVKLPTGAKQDLVGSGTCDFGAQISATIYPNKRLNKFTWFYSLAYLRIGSGALLEDKVTRNIAFGNCGFAWYLGKRFVPKLQFDYHSALYKQSITKQLGNSSVQLVLGSDYFVSKKLILSASFTEDLIVNTSPDFVLQFGLSYQL